MKKLVLSMVVLWGAGAAGVWYWNDLRGRRVELRTAVVRRGDLLATINTTGTLEPEEVADVGVQVAGEIESFGKDPRDPQKTIGYGSPVEEGTLLAQLDDALFKTRVDQARASVGKAEADVLEARARLHQAERDLERSRRLRLRDQVSAQEYDTALASFETAQANLAVADSAVAQARANLEEATVNLGHTTIRSPVKGIILDRRVHIGQTVVATQGASLFLIARDLSRMEIWASVNETDVGQIHVGQPVKFSVAAFPDQSFRGAVADIRLLPSFSQNVVTYTVVIAVDNTKGTLLPYLTARVQFEAQRRSGVLLVPNAALRWKPPAHLVVAEARGADQAPAPSAASRGVHHATLWVRQGELVRPVAVDAGLTDGLHTEVQPVEGQGSLKEGAEVVFGLVLPESDDGALAGNTPFLPRLDTKPGPKK
jgi:HlyD family secretion protein